MAHAEAPRDCLRVDSQGSKAGVIDAVVDDSDALAGNVIALDQVTPSALGYSDHGPRFARCSMLSSTQLHACSWCEPAPLDGRKQVVNSDHLGTRGDQWQRAGGRVKHVCTVGSERKWKSQVFPQNW